MPSADELIGIGTRFTSARSHQRHVRWSRGFIEMQGGLPMVVDGQVIGGIGASFDTPEHDVQIAQAELAAFNDAMHR